jgi:hypothetical protein
VGQTLSIEESDNDIQDNCQQNRQHTGSYNGKVKQATTSFEPDIARQPSKRNSQSSSEKHPPADQDQDDPANHQPTSNIFHIHKFQVEGLTFDV